MSRPAATEKLFPVTGAVTPDVREAIEEYRWANRETVSDFVRAAVEQRVASLGLTKPEPLPEPEPEQQSDAKAKAKA